MRIVAGIIHIIAGFVGLCVFAITGIFSWQDYVANRQYRPSLFLSLLTDSWIIPMILTLVIAIIIIITGIYVFRRKRWEFALVASVFFFLVTALWWFSWGPEAWWSSWTEFRCLSGFMYTGWILGILSIVFTALSKKDFIELRKLQSK